MFSLITVCSFARWQEKWIGTYEEFSRSSSHVLGESCISSIVLEKSLDEVNVQGFVVAAAQCHLELQFADGAVRVICPGWVDGSGGAEKNESDFVRCCCNLQWSSQITMIILKLEKRRQERVGRTIIGIHNIVLSLKLAIWNPAIRQVLASGNDVEVDGDENPFGWNRPSERTRAS